MKGQNVYRRARQRIPGGTQLLSKRPEMLLPELWPSYYSRACGSRVWDLDGNCYVDMSYNGIGACVLGYADPDVNKAVHEAVDAGSMTTLNCAEEVELADLLCDIHPWADMVRYTRSGGEAMAVAVRIARAHTGRDKIAFCGYHGWHDWYLAANLGSGSELEGHLLPGLDPAGVPKGLRGTALPFHYNRIDELERIVSDHGDELAAVVMEPVRNSMPAEGFLQKAAGLARSCGAVFIFDEITAAWRLNTGGAHLLLGVSPDIAVFGKAISNGYPLGAIVGTRAVMESAQNTFISSTYWTERIGPVAGLATIRKHRACNVPERLIDSGRKVLSLWQKSAEETGLPITCSGLPPLAHFHIETEDSQACRTLFTQLMLERGFLASNAYYASYAHSDGDIKAYANATFESFGEIARAIASGTVRQLLKGPVAHSGFRRLT